MVGTVECRLRRRRFGRAFGSKLMTLRLGDSNTVSKLVSEVGNEPWPAAFRTSTSTVGH